MREEDNAALVTAEGQLEERRRLQSVREAMSRVRP